MMPLLVGAAPDGPLIGQSLLLPRSGQHVVDTPHEARTGQNPAPGDTGATLGVRQMTRDLRPERL